MEKWYYMEDERVLNSDVKREHCQREVRSKRS